MKKTFAFQSLFVLWVLILSSTSMLAGDGTKASPYTVAELTAQQETLASSGATVWVKADLKGLGEDGSATSNADTEVDGKTVRHMAGLFADETGSFVAYSWHILGQLDIADLTNTHDLLIALTYGTAGHPYGNSSYPEYATNEEPETAHFSLSEVHGALTLQISNGYRGYHIPSCYYVPGGVVASTVTSGFTNAKGATISYHEFSSSDSEPTLIPKNSAMVLVAPDGTYDFVLGTGLYPQSITNSNSLNGGTNAGINTIAMKNGAVRYHYRFIADGEKVGFVRNCTESTQVELASKDEVFLTVNGKENHFYGNWTWETEDRNWISWQGAKPQQAEEVKAFIDFANNSLGLPVGQNGTVAEKNAGNLGGKTIGVNGVTFSFVNSPTMPTRYYLNGDRGNQLQTIKGGQLRITAPTGYAVTAIRHIPNPAVNPSTGVTTYQVNWKVMKGGGTLTSDKETGVQTWTGNAESVCLESSGATYLNAIEVTCATVNAETALHINEEADSYVVVTTLADFNALADNTLAQLTLTDAVITSGMINEWGYYVQDATAGAHFYCTPLQFSVGDVINGSVYVKKNKQNMGGRIAMTELTNADALRITQGTATPLTGSIADLNTDANRCRLIQLTDVAVKGSAETTATITDAAGNSLVIENGKTNYAPYVYQQDLTTVDYAKAFVEGILYGTAKDGNKLYPLTITNTSTGIATIAADARRLVIYNLQGARMSTLHKGINIVNGRKIVVK